MIYELRFTVLKLVVLVVLSSFVFQPSSLCAQGGLTPPGAPAPTMKSLDQIEARTPISSAPFTISAPGSYYLTRSITVGSGSGITIAANNVMLDLNGFTISSTENPPQGTSLGIVLGTTSGVTNVAIMNGFIKCSVTNNSGTFSGAGFGYGISYSGGVPYNPHVIGLSLMNLAYGGIFLAQYGSIIKGCSVYTVGGNGLEAQKISDSIASDCQSLAIDAANVDGCVGFCSGGATAVNATIVNNSAGYSPAGGIGVNAYTANNCYGSSSTSDGIKAYSAVNCFGVSASGVGVLATNASFCVGSRSGGTAIQAVVANGCVAASGTNLVANKYNMP